MLSNVYQYNNSNSVVSTNFIQVPSRPGLVNKAIETLDCPCSNSNSAVDLLQLYRANIRLFSSRGFPLAWLTSVVDPRMIRHSNY